MTQPAPEAPTQSAGPGPGDAAGVELGAGDLPAYCPNPNMPIWSAHPRVFLDVTHGAGAKCPYCGTLYRLRPGTVLKGQH
ncbi:MAG TPA: zinc-finger domain-containing protein [Burkholderiaceae bacterium]